MAYFATCGPKSGPFRYASAPDVINVMKSSSRHTMIGKAECVGRNLSGVAVWRLIVDDVELPGVWIVVDREFRQME